MDKEKHSRGEGLLYFEVENGRPRLEGIGEPRLEGQGMLRFESRNTPWSEGREDNSIHSTLGSYEERIDCIGSTSKTRGRERIQTPRNRRRNSLRTESESSLDDQNRKEECKRRSRDKERRSKRRRYRSESSSGERQGEREDYAELLTDMLAKRVKYGESLEQYYYTKLNLLNRCQIYGRKAVDCILYGVDDRAIKVGAQAAQFSEPEQILKYFRTVMVGQIRENYDLGSRNRYDRKNNAINRPLSSKPASINSNIRCYNCNELGHPSFKCFKPLIKCSLCDRLGHQAFSCFRKKNSSDMN